jgi:putative ABC transport system permease protein
MKTLIAIAWRNLWRHRMRSVLVMVTVMIGIAAGVFSAAFMLGMLDQKVESAIKTYTAHIQVHPTDYIMDDNEGALLKNPDSLAKEFLAATSDLNILQYTSRISITAMVSSPRKAQGVKINAVNPAAERNVLHLYKQVDVGEYLPAGVRNPVLISHRLASDLGVDLRSRLVLSFQDAQGQIVGGAFRVAGLFHTENSSFDRTQVFINKEDLHQMTSAYKDKAHELVFRMESNGKVEDVANRMASLAYADSLVIRTWKDVEPELGMLIGMMNQMMYIMMVIIILAMGFTIINTMLMAVMERTHEFGVLMAIGMNKRSIFFMIMAESVILSLGGALLGMLISGFLVSYTGEKGIDISAVGEGMEAYGFSAIVYPAVGASFYAVVALMVFVTAIVAAIYPAIKILKLSPADAVRAQ